VRARARGNVPVRRAPLAEVFHPLQDSFWGERHGQVIDPFGHPLGLAQHLRDVSHEELIHAAQEMFAT
jgi:PhnB protein